MGIIQDFSDALKPHATKLNETIHLQGALLHTKLASIDMHLSDLGRPDVGDLWADLGVNRELAALTPVELATVQMNEILAVQFIAVNAIGTATQYPEGTQTVANPVAGKDWSYTIPAGVTARATFITATLKTSAQVAERIAAYRILNPAGRVVWSTAFAGQTASLTRTDQATPPNILLTAGYKIESLTTAIQTEDQWENITIALEQVKQTVRRFILRANGRLRAAIPVGEAAPGSLSPGGDIIFLPGERITAEVEEPGQVEATVTCVRRGLPVRPRPTQMGLTPVVDATPAPTNTHDPARDVIRTGGGYTEVPGQVANSDGNPPLIRQ